MSSPPAQSAPLPMNSPADGSPPSSPPPRRGPSLRWLLATGLLVLVALVAGVAWSSQFRGVASRLRAAFGGAPAVAASGDSRFYTCGMHPWIILPRQGLCPICHMDLTPLEASSITADVTVDPLVLQSIGVREAVAVEEPLGVTVRAVGSVAFDESRVRDVTTRAEGWIERLHVAVTGAAVQEGDPLFDLYSPELDAAQQEWLVALRAVEQAQRAGPPERLASAQIVADLARTRLLNLGVSAAQIDEIERSGRARRTIAFAAPRSGVVVEKEAVEGARVEPGQRVFRIADLSTVWVLASVYEHQLGLVSEGQTALLRLGSIDGRTLEGRVAYIYPSLDPESRQASVRIEFDNADGLLRPGMSATVDLVSPVSERALVVPLESVIDTGTRRVVFVSAGGGRFEPREVEAGFETPDGRVQILGGLAPGERVVTSGQFLLDSESRMREALAKLVRGDMSADQPAPDAPAAETAGSLALSPGALGALTRLLDAYLRVGETLAADSIEGVPSGGVEMSAAIAALTAEPPVGGERFWQDHAAALAAVRDHARRLSSEMPMEAARVSYGILSDGLDVIVSLLGVPDALERPLDRLICGMYDEAPRQGVWLQDARDPVRNPFYGSEMLRCNTASERRRLPPARANAGPGDAKP